MVEEKMIKMIFNTYKGRPFLLSKEESTCCKVGESSLLIWSERMVLCIESDPNIKDYTDIDRWLRLIPPINGMDIYDQYIDDRMVKSIIDNPPKQLLITNCCVNYGFLKDCYVEKLYIEEDIIPPNILDLFVNHPTLTSLAIFSKVDLVIPRDLENNWLLTDIIINKNKQCTDLTERNIKNRERLLKSTSILFEVLAKNFEINFQKFFDL